MAMASPSDSPSSNDAFPSPQEEILVQFRAGKMTMDGTTVKPDARKGLARVVRGDEGLIHFQWLDRRQNLPEDDQIVFPEEAAFEKVQQSSGRVYILKFKHDDRKSFFWMQEVEADGDAHICHLVNFYINRPLELERDEETPESVPQSLVETSEAASGFESSSRDANVEKVPQSIESASGNAAAATRPVQLVDLQRILSSISNGGALSEEANLTLPRDTGPSLAEILKPEVVVPLLENCHLEERLAPFLPEVSGSWTSEAIVELMQSPQFHQQVEAFTHVLRSGQINLSQFGIDPSKCDFTVSSFLEAIEDQVAQSSESAGQNILSSAQGADKDGGKTSNDSVRDKNERDSDAAMGEGR